MDLVTNNAIEITKLALDGLSARHNVLAGNIANADTPGFKRSDVKFEDKLAEIFGEYNTIQAKKIENSAGLVYNPNSIQQLNPVLNENSVGNIDVSETSKDIYANFNSDVINPENPSEKPDGNNINMEYEMAELAKNGTKYTAITAFQERIFRGLTDVIQRGGN